MRPGTAVIAYLFYIFIGAALLSPWVAYAVQGWVEAPFRRILNRCLLGLALIGIWPLIKALGFQSWSEIGLRRDRPVWRDFAIGLGGGAILLGIVATAVLLGGGSQFDPYGNLKANRIIGAALSALAVAFLEEVLFRGAIFTALKRTWNLPVGLWASSAIYAILHFFAEPKDPALVEWSSGFLILGGMLRGFGNLQMIIPGVLNLTLLGAILVLAFRKTGALWMSMGIHAALIFLLKTYATATNPVAGANRWFWGTEKLIDGWLCFMVLGICIVPLLRKAK